jgi:hypothetical protein
MTKNVLQGLSATLGKQQAAHALGKKVAMENFMWERKAFEGK